MYMVSDPERYDVVVSENIFGDIVSEIAAGSSAVWACARQPTSASRMACSSRRMAVRRTSRQGRRESDRDDPRRPR
jgi:hypothetical protein